jgi:hypothetical protein
MICGNRDERTLAGLPTTILVRAHGQAVSSQISESFQMRWVEFAGVNYRDVGSGVLLMSIVGVGFRANLTNRMIQ